MLRRLFLIEYVLCTFTHITPKWGLSGNFLKKNSHFYLLVCLHISKHLYVYVSVF